MAQKLKVGDKVEVKGRRDHYEGLTGVISEDADRHGFFRVDIDRDDEWLERTVQYVTSWKNWYFRGDNLVKIEPAVFKEGQSIVVKGAEGLSDLFNGMTGTVVKSQGENGPYLCEFKEADNFFGGVSTKRIVLPSRWMAPAPEEEPVVEDKSVALAALLQSYRLEDRRRTVVSSSTLDKHRAAEVLALLEGK